MAYDNGIESIYNLQKYVSKTKHMPIYFFFGEDDFTINNAIKTLTDLLNPLVASDFDTEVIKATKEISAGGIIDLASAFPFGDGKKVITVKNFENVQDKKSLASFVNNPTEFTILIISQIQKKIELNKEPYLSLKKHNFLFEAKELKGAELKNWLVRKAKHLGFILGESEGSAMIDLIGDNKALLENHLQKFSDFLGENKEITLEVIEKLTTKTKEYTIFNMQDALSRGDKAEALKVGYWLINNGTEMVYIISMLTRYISTLSKVVELNRHNMSEFEAAKLAGVSPFYYKKCRLARYMLNEYRLLRATRALLESDIAIKSTSIDQKSALTVLISKILE